MGIQYHINSTSPFYLYNSGDNYARRQYYGINATPNIKVDGVLGNSASSYYTYYNQRRNISSPVELNLGITVSDQLELQADITAESGFSAQALKFRTALIALAIDTLGRRFERVMLDLAPSAGGVNFNISSGETVTLNVQIPLPAFVDLPNLAVVGWVQRESSREVLQADFRDIPLNFPCLTAISYSVDDTLGGNGNGRAEPGETARLYVTLENGLVFAPATGVVGLVSTTEPLINVTSSIGIYPDINPGATGTNIGSPYVFDVDPLLQPHNVRFTLDVAANGGYFTSQSLEIMVGVPQYLIVDDDGGQDYEQAYVEDLNGMGIAFDVWDVNSSGAVSAGDLGNYAYVIWFTGRETQTLTVEDQSALADYLDAGGNLFMTSQNLGDDIGAAQFYSQYMHATHLGDVGTTRLAGVDGDPISSGSNILLYGGIYSPTSQSYIEPGASATVVYRYSNPYEPVAGIKYDGDYNLVYFAFPQECVNPSSGSYTTRSELLGNVLNWLTTATGVESPSRENTPDRHLLCEIYPNPFNPRASLNLTVERRGLVKVGLFNLLGEKVTEVHSGVLAPGVHCFELDGSGLSSGIYLVRVDTPGESLSRKIVLMK